MLKKFYAVAMAALLATVSFIGGCGTTGNGEFNLSPEKPWGGVINNEKCVYNYEKTSDDGTIVASGKYTVEIITENGITTIKSSLTVTNTQSQEIDSVTSTVTMDERSLYPHYSEKTVVDSINGNGYSLVMNYETGESSMKFDKNEEAETPIALPTPGQEHFDNEQLYQIVRAATNIDTEGNSGLFKLISGTDSYVYKTYTTYNMIYTVGAAETIKAAGMENKYGVNADGNIPCRKVTIRINDSRAGSGTIVHYADSTFDKGGKKVPVRIFRPEYSTTDVGIKYHHTYTLCDYRAI